MGASPRSLEGRERERFAMRRTNPIPKAGKIRVASLWFLFCLVVGLTACFGRSSKTPANDPEQQSRSEYDLARDLWLRQGRAREALEHALRSYELDDRNFE